jgi:hypothetical protein
MNNIFYIRRKGGTEMVALLPLKGAIDPFSLLSTDCNIRPLPEVCIFRGVGVAFRIAASDMFRA